MVFPFATYFTFLLGTYVGINKRARFDRERLQETEPIGISDDKHTADTLETRTVGYVMDGRGYCTLFESKGAGREGVLYNS